MSTTRRRVHKKSDPISFDKYELYSKAVQSPDTDAEFLRAAYKELRGREPKSLREDFCGSFLLACEWVKQGPNFEAYGVDRDPEPIEYGRKKYLPKLRNEQKQRIHLLEQDVLKPDLPNTDLVVAMNFSYFVFQTRKLMKSYFENVFKSLKKEGLFVLDIFGGSLCYDASEESTKYSKFTYYWDQEGFDPISNKALFHIHFKVKRQKKLENVFTYDWRMWSIPELRELMEEVGFKRSHVYWEGTTKNGEGDGNFARAEKGEACQSWIAYIVGEK